MHTIDFSVHPHYPYLTPNKSTSNKRNRHFHCSFIHRLVRCSYRHLIPPTGMYVREGSLSVPTPLLLLRLLFLSTLLLLDALLLGSLRSRTRPLFTEFLVLFHDTGFSRLGFGTAASSTKFRTDIVSMHPFHSGWWVRDWTHVNSTLILLAGDFPSSNDEW